MEDILKITPYVLIVLTIATYLILGKRLKCNHKLIRYVRFTHYAVLVIGLMVFILSQFDLFLSIVWINKLIAWLFLISWLMLALFRRQLSSEIEKNYAAFLLISPVIFILSWIVPMLGLVMMLSFSNLFYADTSKIVYNDKKYMLILDERLLSYTYEPSIYVKHGILSEKVKDVTLIDWDLESILSVKPQGADSIQITYLNDAKEQLDTIIRFEKDLDD